MKEIKAALKKKAAEDSAAFARLEAGQAKLISMGKATMAKIDKSTSTICTAVFEATEVTTPTCFVILPFELPDPSEDEDEDASESMLDAAEGWIETVTGFVETGESVVSDPVSYAKNFLSSTFTSKVETMKQKLVDKTLYLYLVDEYSGKPVYDTNGVFPVKIETSSDLVQEHMPMMRMGLQAMAVANGAASIANMFCPFVPRTLVPERITSKAKQFVDGLDKESNVSDFSSVQAVVDGDDGGTPKRGAGLRNFQKFLQEKDPESLFAGLKRVCGKDCGNEGNAIWVTDESADLMIIESTGTGSSIIEENERLKRELQMEQEEEVTAQAEMTNDQSTVNSGFVAKTRSNVEQASDSNAAKPIADWNVDEVASWLRDVMKLNDVATAAVGEEISGAEVVELDKEDWKELGTSGIKAAKLFAAVKKLL